MDIWHVVFYNFLFVIDVCIIAGAISSAMEKVIKSFMMNFSTLITMEIDKYYEAKKDFLVSLVKDDNGKEVFDRLHRKDSSPFN